MFKKRTRDVKPPVSAGKRFLVGLVTLTIMMTSAGLAIGVDWRLGAGVFVVMLVVSPFISAKWNF